MKTCLICRKEKDCFNVEHVIPDAIGGNFTIDAVCCQCNEKLGSRVDPLLTEHVFSLFLRKKYHLKSQNNRTIDNPLNKQNSKFNQSESPDVKLSISKDGKTFKIEPLVEKKGQKLRAIFDKSDPNFKKFIEKHGLTQNSFIEASVNKIKGETKIDLKDFQVALIKIAYEFGCEKIPSFRDSQRAIDISNFLYDTCYSDSKKKEHSFDNFLIKSTILNSSAIKPLDSLFKSGDNLHYLAATSINDLGTVCYIQIFNVFYSIILLSDEQLLEVDEYLVIENDILKSEIEELSLSNLIERMQERR